MLTLEEQEQHLERIKKARLEAQWNLRRLVDCNIDEVDFFSYINHSIEPLQRPTQSIY